LNVIKVTTRKIEKERVTVIDLGINESSGIVGQANKDPKEVNDLSARTLLQFNVLSGAVQNTTITQKQSDNVRQRLKHEIIIISTLIKLKSYYCA